MCAMKYEIRKRSSSQGPSRSSRTVILNQPPPTKGFGIVYRHCCFTQQGSACCLHLVKRIQRCCRTPHTAEGSPHPLISYLAQDIRRAQGAKRCSGKAFSKLHPTCMPQDSHTSWGSGGEMWLGKRRFHVPINVEGSVTLKCK